MPFLINNIAEMTGRKMVLMTKDRSRVFCRAFLTNTVSDHAQKSEWLILIHSERKRSNMEFVHKSILLDEVIENLNIREDGCYVDGTLGGAGHSYQICTHLGEKGRLVGIDQDADAIQAATKRLEPYKDKVSIVRSNYVNFDNVLDELGIDKVNGILLDLGVSSYQLDEASRGFTYREDVPLDMRMDQRNPKTAADIVNEYSEMELYRMIRDYGEDRFAKNIAKHIVRAREKAN